MRSRLSARWVVASVMLAASGCASAREGSDPGLSGGSEGGDVPPAAQVQGSGAGGADGSGGFGSMSTGTDGPSAVGTTSGSGAGPVDGCIGADLLAGLEQEGVMVGAELADETAMRTAIDLRYIRLRGVLPDGDGPCQVCDASCAPQASTCVGEACAWWGCRSGTQAAPEGGVAPGELVRSFADRARTAGHIPMISYEVLLEASGALEGGPEVAAAADPVFLRRYLADFRFMLQSLGEGAAFVHVEPGFWAYAQQLQFDPRAIDAAVPVANPEDCASHEANLVGLGECLVTMTRKYALGAKIGLHASGWATPPDSLLNDDPMADVTSAGMRVGAFLAEVAPSADLVFVDASDRDAGYYESIGQEAWWDDTNATLPSFHQAFAWSRAVSEQSQKPHFWWRVPLGNVGLPGGPNRWKDNRVDYFFAHMNEVAAAHGVGVAFGAGADDQVTPETDGDNFVDKANFYAEADAAPLCTP